MKFDEYIKNNNNSFLITREIKGKYYEFGTFSSQEKARKECERLDNNGWPIKINKPKYQDFYHPPNINSNETNDIFQKNDWVILKISTKLNTNLNKWYIQLVYHDNKFDFGLFINQEEAEELIQKFLINGNITNKTILSILNYDSLEDFKTNTNVEVFYDINLDKHNVQRINNGKINILGSYNAEKQAENVKKSYLNSLNKLTCFKTKEKKDFIHFADENLSYYENLQLQDFKIISNAYQLPLNFIELKKLMKDFNDSHLSIYQLSQKYKISENIIKKIIFNYESKKFNQILKEGENKTFNEIKDSTKNMNNNFQINAESGFNSPIQAKEDIHFADLIHSYYDHLSLKNDGHVIFRSKPLKLKIYEIEDLYSYFKDGKSVEELSKKYKVSPYLIKKFIFNYESGKFDKVLKKWEQSKSSINSHSNNLKLSDFRENLNKKNLDFADEIHTYYSDLSLTNDGSIIAGNLPLLFKVYDIKNIYTSFKNGKSVSDLRKQYKVTGYLIKKIIFNHESHIFDNIINEWENKSLLGSSSFKTKTSKVNKNLKIDFADEVRLFNQKLSLKRNGDVFAGRFPLQIKIYEVDDIFNLFIEGVSVKSLSKKYEVSPYLIKKFIFNYESGKFDTIFKQWENKKIDTNLNASKSGNKSFNDNLVSKNNIDFADEIKSYYSDLRLNNKGGIYSKNNLLKIKVYNLKNMFISFKEGVSVESLSKKYEVSPYLIKKFIFNYESGKFDTIIKEWEEKDSSLSNINIRERPELYSYVGLPYKFESLTSDGHLKMLNAAYLKVTVLEARNIHESYNEGQEIDYLKNKYDLSENTIKKIILRYDAGDFDESLKTVLKNNPSDKTTNINIINNKPFTNLRKDENGNLTESTLNIPLDFTLDEIKKLFEEYKNNQSIKSLITQYNKSPELIERIINRMIVGDFDLLSNSNSHSISENINFILIDHDEDKVNSSKVQDSNEPKENNMDDLNLNNDTNNLKQENYNLKTSKNQQTEYFNNNNTKLNNPRSLNLNDITQFKIKEEKKEKDLTSNEELHKLTVTNSELKNNILELKSFLNKEINKNNELKSDLEQNRKVNENTTIELNTITNKIKELNLKHEKQLNHIKDLNNEIENLKLDKSLLKENLSIVESELEEIKKHNMNLEKNQITDSETFNKKESNLNTKLPKINKDKNTNTKVVFKFVNGEIKKFRVKDD